ncbi:unnamed protein product [Moneuplotes crassus]|uniref:Uncharacterized protein n=1 Tax=Euplotes crassus TaxID=5936 RepID=A0AAD1XAV1_EUPCR|nr:unnamed protein product [Moneuplotes crassus]
MEEDRNKYSYPKTPIKNSNLQIWKTSTIQIKSHPNAPQTTLVRSPHKRKIRMVKITKALSNLSKKGICTRTNKKKKVKKRISEKSLKRSMRLRKETGVARVDLEEVGRQQRGSEEDGMMDQKSIDNILNIFEDIGDDFEGIANDFTETLKTPKKSYSPTTSQSGNYRHSMKCLKKHSKLVKNKDFSHRDPLDSTQTKNFKTLMNFEEYTKGGRRTFKSKKIPKSQYIPFVVYRSTKKLTKSKEFTFETQQRSQSRKRENSEYYKTPTKKSRSSMKDLCQSGGKSILSKSMKMPKKPKPRSSMKLSKRMSLK